ncbi:MAG: hypothetical protein JWP06_256 [Candidatus Saccharibacteria bacterium]|nr:hypothetical protein [Candidatus Saccharibacteria bacterium]
MNSVSKTRLLFVVVVERYGKSICFETVHNPLHSVTKKLVMILSKLDKEMVY